jgi:hypothetical protein
MLSGWRHAEGPRAVQRGAEVVRHGDHGGTGDRVRDDWNVRRPGRDRRRRLPAHHHPAVRGRPHCAAARRAAAEGLRPRLRHLPLHRHQHLRDHRLEGFLTGHSQHWYANPPFFHIYLLMWRTKICNCPRWTLWTMWDTFLKLIFLF